MFKIFIYNPLDTCQLRPMRYHLTTNKALHIEELGAILGISTCSQKNVGESDFLA